MRTAILYSNSGRSRVSLILWIRVPSHLTDITSAEVIKIEHPMRGDDTRAWGPPYATYKADSGKQGPGESAYFLAVIPTPRTLL